MVLLGNNTEGKKKVTRVFPANKKNNWGQTPFIEELWHYGKNKGRTKIIENKKDGPASGGRSVACTVHTL